MASFTWSAGNNSFTPDLWCATFVANSKNITFGNNCEIDRTTPFTLAAWVYIDDPDHVQPTVTIAAKFQDPTPMGFDMEVIDGTLFWHQIHFYPGNELRVQSDTSTIPSNQWLHLAITGDGTGTYAGLKMYINAISKHTNNVEDTLSGSSATSQPFYIGYTQNEAEGLDGTVVNFGFYNRPLSQAELLRVYAVGKTGDLLSLPSASSLLHYWVIGQGDSVGVNGILDRVGSVPGTTVGMSDSDLGLCPY